MRTLFKGALYFTHSRFSTRSIRGRVLIDVRILFEEIRYMSMYKCMLVIVCISVRVGLSVGECVCMFVKKCICASVYNECVHWTVVCVCVCVCVCARCVVPVLLY